VPVEKGKKNPLLPFVENVRLYSDETLGIQRDETPPPAAEYTPEEIAEGKAAEDRIDRMAPGSFERMMGVFGSSRAFQQ
jgi:hypothetical protein